MGGVGGVEVRENSIRIKFTYLGERQAQTLMLNGEPMKPTAPNVRYAHRLAVEIRQKIRHGTFSMSETFPAGGTGGTLTVAGQLDVWLSGQRVTESTRLGYLSCCRFWKGVIGEKPLRSLKLSDVLAAIASHPEWSGKTVNNRVDVLRQALALAVLDNVVSANVADNVPRASHQKPDADPFSLEEAELLIAYARQRYDAQVTNYIEFKFFTGVRTGESFGLKWGNVDWLHSRVLVSDSIVAKVHQTSTKTSSSRLVTLNTRALAALTAQKAHTYLQGDYVWHDPRHGSAWATENAFNKGFWLRALTATGVRHRPPYNTRHTYATMLLMAGARPAYVAKQMGHSVEVLLKDYARWLDGDRDDAEQQRLEAFIAIVPSVSLRKEKPL